MEFMIVLMGSFCIIGGVLGHFTYKLSKLGIYLSSLIAGISPAFLLWRTDFPSGWQGIDTLNVSDFIWTLIMGIAAFIGSSITCYILHKS